VSIPGIFLMRGREMERSWLESRPVVSSLRNVAVVVDLHGSKSSFGHPAVVHQPLTFTRIVLHDTDRRRLTILATLFRFSPLSLLHWCFTFH